MVKNLFVVVLRYIVPIEAIEEHRATHWDFLDEQYAKGIFVASGPQVPKTGGIIIAQCQNRNILKDILARDPFSIHHLAEYQIFEFTPTRHIPELKELLS